MDINRPSFDIAELSTLHSQRRDLALNLPRPGARTMSLTGYLRKRHAEVIDRLARAAFLKGIVDECRAEVHRLIEGADTPEKRRAVLLEAERLNGLAEEAGRQLEELGHG